MEWTSTLLGVWWRSMHKRKGWLEVQSCHTSQKWEYKDVDRVLLCASIEELAHYEPWDWPCPLNRPSRSQEGWALEGWGMGGRKTARERISGMEMNAHERKVEVTRRWSGSGANRWSRPLGGKTERLNTHRDTRSVCMYCIPTGISTMMNLRTVQRIEDYIISNVDLCSQRRKNTQIY